MSCHVEYVCSDEIFSCETNLLPAKALYLLGLGHYGGNKRDIKNASDTTMDTIGAIWEPPCENSQLRLSHFHYFFNTDLNKIIQQYNAIKIVG